MGSELGMESLKIFSYYKSQKSVAYLCGNATLSLDRETIKNNFLNSCNLYYGRFIVYMTRPLGKFNNRI